MKDLINLVLVDDNEGAHRLTEEYFGTEGINAELPNVKFNKDLSLRIGGIPVERKNTIEMIISRLASYDGPTICLVDFDLGLQHNDRREIKRQIESTLRTTIPDNLQQQLDGLKIAIEAIKQTQLNPLLIFLQTALGNTPHLRDLLNGYAKSLNRESDVMVVNSGTGDYLGYSAANAETARKIFVEAVGRYREHFKTPLERFFSILDERDLHPQIDADCKKQAVRLLTTLLDLSGADVIEKIWTVWSRQGETSIKESLKRLGIYDRDSLSVSSCWFYALAAFRHCNDPRNWEGLFTVADLEEGLEAIYLTPSQTAPILRETIRCFYEMCAELFYPEKDENGRYMPGPLESVRLSKNRGFRMLLKFSSGPMNPMNGASLFERIGKWRNANLGWTPINEGDKGRATSRAIWRFWLATSLGDAFLPYSEEGDDKSGIFNNSQLWRMNIYSRPSSRSEVVFHV